MCTLDSCKTNIINIYIYIQHSELKHQEISAAQRHVWIVSLLMSPKNSVSAKKMQVSHGSASPVDWPKVKIHLRTARSRETRPFHTLHNRDPIKLGPIYNLLYKLHD